MRNLSKVIADFDDAPTDFEKDLIKDVLSAIIADLEALRFEYEPKHKDSICHACLLVLGNELKEQRERLK